MRINSKKTEQDQDSFKPKKFWKFKTIFFILIGLIFIVIGKLFYLQVIEADRYREIARRQHESRITLRAERGNIYDRRGRLLVTSVQSFSFAADPTVLKDISERLRVCKALANATGGDVQELFKKIELASGSFVWLARSILPGQSIALDTLTAAGFIKIKEPRRVYVYGNSAAQILGCTDVDNIGIAGIELAYDTLLKGTAGIMNVYRDATGKVRPAANLQVIEAINGKSIRLTLDIDLQRIAEYELKQAVVASNASSGTVLAIEPSTGEIIAMASYPTFDPNSYNFNEPATMRNRAISDIYEPGSTFKLITAAAALEEGIVQPQTIVDGHDGLLDMGTYQIKDDHPLGRVTFSQAVEKSSNIIFSELSNRIENQKFYKFIRDFGFGMTLGLELPAEASGKIKSLEEFDEPTKRFLGFGYGIAVTPLQIVAAYSAVANGGVLMRPYIISEIINNNGDAYRKNSPRKIREVIKKQTARTLSDLLISVVERGTGIKAKIDGLHIAGKTGTSQQIDGKQYSKEDYNASFAGFFPAENPTIAMIVLIDRPRVDIYGGSVAAPVFGSIVRRWTAINPELVSSSTSQVFSPSISVPELCGLYKADADRIAAAAGLTLQFDSDTSGIVTNQNPIAGSLVFRNSVVRAQSSNSNLLKYEKLEVLEKKMDLKGMSLRRALAVLSSAQIKVKVIGSGRVESQQWSRLKSGDIQCVVKCK